MTAHTIPALVTAAASRFGDTEAMVDDGTRLSFSELGERVTALARSLLVWGLRPGDRVGVWGPNSWEWAVAALAAHTAGGVVVPVNTRFKGEEASFVLGKARTRMLFTVSDFLGTDYVQMLLRNPTGVPSSLEEIVVMGGTTPPGTTAFAELMASEVDDCTATLPSISGADTCHIMFTSGTTGQPKGVVLNHAAICRAYANWASVIGLRHGDRYLIVNPFFHSFGLNAGILACLMTGATMIPHPVFDVPSVMERIAAERVSVLPGPPALYQTILNHPDLDSFDMSTLRLSVTGAAPVPVPMITAMRELLGFEVIVTGYGLTEASGIATMCRHDDDPETISTTSGRAIDDVDVRVVGPDHRELPRGEPGEIVIQGYNVMDGYLGDPVATDAAVVDGWLYTGDIGVMNDDGYVTITDRLKDMFICGGFNAYPAEIETTLLAHPAVGQAAVVGRPHKRLGEVGHAFVVLAAGNTPTDSSSPQVSASPQVNETAAAARLKDEIINWCRERMANYKVPRGVTFLAALPLNASGKVRKHVLRRQLSATD